MEQRPLRLGDILDDYCPRERRVTNHAVVAMIEEDVKQTRCTTCDAEHAYKGGRAPRRRKKDTPGTLYEEVLAGLPEAAEAGAPSDVPPLEDPTHDVPSVAVWAQGDEARGTEVIPGVQASPPALHPQVSSDVPFEAAPEPEDVRDEPEDSEPGLDGPVHRRLIRATLPRVEGQKDARPIPEFTVRQAPTRGAGHGGGRPNPNYRGERVRMAGGNGHGNGHGEPNGNRVHSGNGPSFKGNRSGGGRPPMGRPGPPGARTANGGGSRGKRGRGPRG